MPELPEVETTVNGLKNHILNQRIKNVIFHRKNIRYPLEPTWVTLIKHRQITAISRRAKLIIMSLDKGCLLWHLGMTGSLRMSQDNETKRKHDHIEFYLANQRILRFHDPRRFGYMQHYPDEDTAAKQYAHYGPEPLSNVFNADYLWQLSRQKKTTIKNLIMNQEVVVGVGNIYACEALFMANIRPQTASGKISKARYQRLVEAIQEVLKKSIQQGGTTLKDFENAEAKPGYFQQSLSVYGRYTLPCLICKTEIKSIKLGGRNSFYCPQCQY